MADLRATLWALMDATESYSNAAHECMREQAEACVAQDEIHATLALDPALMSLRRKCQEARAEFFLALAETDKPGRDLAYLANRWFGGNG